MKTMLAIAAILVSGSALAEPPHAKPEKKGTDMICRDADEIGTRLASHRICMTRDQWEQSRRDARQTVDHAQTSQTNPKGG
jgi:hypothetical protein